MNKTKQTLIWSLIIIVFISGLGYLVYKNSAPTGPGQLDGFAQCLKDKGATFYGAFWCPHCQKEKSWFGSSVHLLPYVECSTPDGNAQTQICIDKKISGYPTWIFADGSKLSGEIPLEQLAQKTGCVLPAGVGTPK
jgi:thiol-disulfide isomerase/thioredoxin